MNPTLRHLIFFVAVAAGSVFMAGCAVEPRYRDRGQHYNQSGYYDDDYYQRRAQYDCSRCGTIRDIERVYIDEGRGQTSGGGAVIGAIIGGVLGNTIGKGDGRRAATVGGAVAGGLIGNEIERSGNRDGYGREAWQFSVRMDNGQWAQVTQWENRGFRPGDRVMIRNNELMLLR